MELQKNIQELQAARAESAALQEQVTLLHLQKSVQAIEDMDSTMKLRDAAVGLLCSQAMRALVQAKICMHVCPSKSLQNVP